MNNNHLKFTVAYAIVFVLALLASFKQLSILSEITTPLITIVLLFFLSISTRLKGRFHQRLFTGLVFALTGNTLILMQTHNPSYFTYGLIAMVICYVFFISAFYLDFRSAPELDKKGARVAIVCCAIGCTAFYFFLRPHLGINKLPVLGNALIFALLVMMASFRNERVNPKSFKLILTGVLFLTLSGLLLACHHFINQAAFPDFLMISAYMIGQYLVIYGGVERKLLRTETDI